MLLGILLINLMRIPDPWAATSIPVFPHTAMSFQFRRIYLGYDYNISKKFTAELLLAAEDNFPAGSPPVGSAAGTTTSTARNSTGDLTSNQKMTFILKNMNIRWKGIWKGTDLVIGEMSTPPSRIFLKKSGVTVQLKERSLISVAHLLMISVLHYRVFLIRPPRTLVIM